MSEANAFNNLVAAMFVLAQHKLLTPAVLDDGISKCLYILATSTKSDADGEQVKQMCAEVGEGLRAKLLAVQNDV